MAAANNVVHIDRPARKNLPSLEKQRKELLGEFIVLTGADTLPLEVLVGVLIAAVDTKCHQEINVWASRGAAFFDGKAGKLQ